MQRRLTCPHSVPIAFEYLTPKQVCKAFSRGLNRPVKYARGPVKVEVSVPAGYKENLEVLEDVLGRQGAPYFGPDLEDNCTKTALDLWEGYRGMEEYAREVFPIEEKANGLTWMEAGDDAPRKGIEPDFSTKAF